MPDLASFNDAVQMPALYHPSVGKLKDGQLLLNSLGLPVPNSGNFAVVYQTQYENKRHALRCFIRPAPDQEERFRHISEHLKQRPCRYFVDFQFHPEGLRVGGKWQALMIMEWREGISLERYITSLLSDAKGLLNLAGQWVDMFDHLRTLDIAHGDIHPDNVIVHDGQLYLIDYDAVYIPSLEGRQIQEVGQRNYQHPQRNRKHYGLNIDHFPAWVIYYTLVLLSIDPDLWKRHQGGDQKLLFTAEDYKNPSQSALLLELEQSDNAILKLIAKNMKSLSQSEFADLPALSHAIVRAGGLPTQPQAPSDWWRDHQSSQTSRVSQTWLKKR